MKEEEVQHNPGDPLSVREAAKLIGVHWVTVYRWIEAQEISHIKFGGSLFIPFGEVRRLREQRQEGPPRKRPRNKKEER